ncbi:hypothetical protein PMAYCL1PPCAC_13262, partial [Pristionchus mayeri]
NLDAPLLRRPFLPILINSIFLPQRLPSHLHPRYLLHSSSIPEKTPLCFPSLPRLRSPPSRTQNCSIVRVTRSHEHSGAAA